MVAESAERAALRAELLQHGLPLVLDSRDRVQDLLGRCAPALAALALAVGSLATMSARLSAMTPAQQQDPAGTDAVVIGGALLALLLAPPLWWVLAWVLRRLPARARSAVAAVAVLVLLGLALVAPADAGVTWWAVLLLVIGVLVATYYGLGSMTAWAARRSGRELERLGAMVGRVLPILMLTLLFSFYNAEIWQVVAQLSMARTWAAAGVITALGVGLSVLTARDEVRRLVREHDAAEHGADLRRGERVNITLVCVLINLIQVGLLAVVVVAFYIAFGVLSVSRTTATQWIGSPPAPLPGLLAGMPVSLPLVQVCLILGAFSAVSFAASTAADPMYRSIFLDPALDEVRAGLAIRTRYARLGRARAAGAGHPGW